MKTILLYNVDGVYKTEEFGPYVIDAHPAELDNNQGFIEADSISVPINDGMMINIKVVRQGGKLGFLFAEGEGMSSYCYRSVERPLFKYDQIRIYSNKNLADDEAYAIVREDSKWKVLKLDANNLKVSVIQTGAEDENLRDMLACIPEEYCYGMNPFTYTPERITQLNESEIFVFGSNKEGRHIGGAAKIAAEKFGAQAGVGVGRTGKCYAIPTMDGSLDLISQYVEGFRCYALCHPELTFLVTRIGCGIAGWKDAEIAPLFNFGPFYTLPNLVFPKEWDCYLNVGEQ